MTDQKPETRRRRLRLRPRSPKASGDAPVLALDIGATKVSTALIDADGRLLMHGGRQIHANDGFEGVVKASLESLRGCLQSELHKPFALGVGVAGQVDATSGSVRYAPNLGWKDAPLGARLREALRLPVIVANDVRAATMGEWKRGAGVGETEMFCLFIGTGIGGSAVCGGRLVSGGSNSAGEVGHMTIVAEGRPCRCPNRGCLEAYAGGWAIAARAKEEVLRNPEAGGVLLSHSSSLDAITAETVRDAYRAGDPLAQRIVEESIDYLAAGVVSIVNAFNPRRVVLGGGVTEGWPQVTERIANVVRTRCQPPAAQAVRIVRAALGANAVLIGAAEMARNPV